MVAGGSLARKYGPVLGLLSGLLFLWGFFSEPFMAALSKPKSMMVNKLDEFSVSAAGAGLKIVDGRLDPPQTGWVYQVKVDEVSEEGVRLILALYANGIESELDTGPHWIPKAQTKAFRHFELTVDDSTYGEARLTLKRIIP